MELKFDNSLEELLKDDKPRTNDEFLEHLKFSDNDISINDIKIYKQPLFNKGKIKCMI